MMRVEHEYDSGGALSYLTAHDVHRTKVSGSCAPSTGIEPFMALAEQVMTTEPHASAKRVFWVVDNGSSHRGKAAIKRLAKRSPNAVMAPHPRARLLAQPSRDLLLGRPTQSRLPNDFTDLADAETRLAALEQRYNGAAKLFEWKFATADLHGLLARLDRHTAPATAEAA
jgi:hypothetical protein